MAHPPKSNWTPLSLHFRHIYERGYRYLDHCGEFMVRMENRYGFISTESLPTGAKMFQPETGTKLEVDTSGLRIQQELPQDNGTSFIEIVVGVTQDAAELFQPEEISYTGFAAKHYKAYGSESAALAASLQLCPYACDVLSHKISMTPRSQNLTYVFTAGSYELEVDLQPISFGVARRENLLSAGFNSPTAQRNRIDRLNKRTSSINSPSGFALELNIDLREWNPPTGELNNHFAELRRYVDMLTEFYSHK